jgi:hypothetical protein
MADPKPVIYSKDLSLEGLQTLIRNHEALNRSLQKVDIAKVIKNQDDEGEVWTIAYYSRGAVALKSLDLETDTDAGRPAPAGKTLVCRGRAMIGGTPTPVVAFRRQ